MDFDCICLSVYIVNMLSDHIFFSLKILLNVWTSSHYILQLSGGRNPHYSVPIFTAITEHLGLSWINQTCPFPGENSSHLYLGNHNTCSTFFHYSFFCSLFAFLLLSQECSQPASSSGSVVQFLFLCHYFFHQLFHWTFISGSIDSVYCNARLPCHHNVILVTFGGLNVQFRSVKLKIA